MTHALLFVGNILCDPKVRENATLRDYLETLYLEMYTQLADDVSDAAIAKCSIDVVLRVIQRRDGRKVVAELRKGPDNELLGN